MNINVSEHTNYLSGYMDAVGRSLTTDKELCCLSARVFDSIGDLASAIECEVIEGDEIESITSEFEAGIKKIFEVDARERLMFYLTEYVQWYEEFTSSCRARRVKLKGQELPNNQLAWLVNVNGAVNIFLYISRQIKNA